MPIDDNTHLVIALISSHHRSKNTRCLALIGKKLPRNSFQISQIFFKGARKKFEFKFQNLANNSSEMVPLNDFIE